VEKKVLEREIDWQEEEERGRVNKRKTARGVRIIVTMHCLSV